MLRLRFDVKPAAVLAEHRPIYKIAQLLLILLASRGGRSSSLRLHLFNWALKRPGRFHQLKDAAEGRSLGVVAWGFDPALAIALRFAVAERLVSQSSTGYLLTPFGRSLADAFAGDDELLPLEKEQLKSVGKLITEKMVDEAAKGWASGED